MKVFYMDKKRIFITGGIALAIIAVILITSVLSRNQGYYCICYDRSKADI